MKFSCEKHILQAAVATASRATVGKSPIPALEGLLIEAGTDVKITGYDLKKGIFTIIHADVSEPGAVVLGARLFGEIVKNLPDGILSVSVEKGTLAVIKCGKSEFSVIGTSAEEYPEVQSDGGDYQIGLPQGKLKAMINQTIFAVSTNESRPVYTGLLFEVEKGFLNIVAVDGYRLAMRREEMSLIKDCEDNSFIVPGAAMSDVEKICADSQEAVTVTVGQKQISFSFGETVLISRRLEGEFLNYRKSVPTSFNINAIVEKSDFQRVVERVSLIIDDRVKNPLRCFLTRDGITFVCVTALGRAVDSISLDNDGGDLEIGFNNRYLLDAIKAAPAEKLTICLGTSTSPCVLKPESGDDSFLYMILPVRLKAEE